MDALQICYSPNFSLSEHSRALITLYYQTSVSFCPRCEKRRNLPAQMSAFVFHLGRRHTGRSLPKLLFSTSLIRSVAGTHEDLQTVPEERGKHSSGTVLASPTPNSSVRTHSCKTFTHLSHVLDCARDRQEHLCQTVTSDLTC